MKKILITGSLIIAALVGSLALAQEPRLLAPGEETSYHRCLRAAWVDDYCRWHAGGYLSDYGLAYAACLRAHHIRLVPFRGYDVATRDACWTRAQRIGASRIVVK